MKSKTSSNSNVKVVSKTISLWILLMLSIKSFIDMLLVNNIIRSKYIVVENNKIEISFSNCISGITFQSPYFSKSEYIVRKQYFNFISFLQKSTCFW